MIDLYNPFAKYNRPDEIMPGEDTGGSGSDEPPEEQIKQFTLCEIYTTPMYAATNDWTIRPVEAICL